MSNITSRNVVVFPAIGQYSLYLQFKFGQRDLPTEGKIQQRVLFL